MAGARLARAVPFLAAALLAGVGVSALTPHVPYLEAELVVDRIAFRLQPASGDGTLLQGVASPTVHVSSFTRAALAADVIVVDGAVVRGTPGAAVAVPRAVVVTPAVDGSSIQFRDVRITDFELEPDARLTVSASDRGGLSLLPSGRETTLTLSFGSSASSVDCQNCVVNGVDTGGLARIRLTGAHRRARISGPAGLALALEPGQIDDVLRVGDVDLFHASSTSTESYVRECALQFPAAPHANRTCVPRALVTLDPPAGEAMALKFVELGAGRLKLQVNGRSRVTLDGKPLAATQLARAPRPLVWGAVTLGVLGLVAPLATRRPRAPAAALPAPATQGDDAAVDVFVSYAQEDRAVAEHIVGVLRRRPVHVWWDPHIEVGDRFDVTIERALACAKCVVVLWSAASIDSRWVRAEASDAATRGVLCPVRIEPVTIPLEFRLFQTLDVFEGEDGIPELAAGRLLAAVNGFLDTPTRVEPTGVEPAQPTA